MQCTLSKAKNVSSKEIKQHAARFILLLVSNFDTGNTNILLPAGKSIEDLKEEQNELDAKYGIVKCPE